MMRMAFRGAAPRAASFLAASPAVVSFIRSIAHDAYVNRHIGFTDVEAAEMMKLVGWKSLEDLTKDVVPADIARPPMAEIAALSEADALRNLRTMMSKNRSNYKSLIGQGYYETITPPVIQRNILESPGWYTPYTPYQPEISQGRLESLLNYQTMITDLTSMQFSNASLLDQATAASESMFLAAKFHKRQKRTKFFVSSTCFKSTIDMILTRAEPIGVEVVVGNLADVDLADPKLCGILVQTPDANGALHDFSEAFARARANKVVTVCGTDLLALTLLKPAGEFGADVVFGSAQRFGIPLGFGGPHPAFLAVKDEFKRSMPGRLVGVSKDSSGNRALRLALQTREQHIKREHATSNICTAQALLANMSAMYAVYHGPVGLKEIAERVHTKAKMLACGANIAGHTVVTSTYFDTIVIKLKSITAKDFMAKAERRRINVFPLDDKTISISTDEATTDEHVAALVECMGISDPQIATLASLAAANDVVPAALKRTSKYLELPIFNTHHSEHGLMRYIYELQRRDFGMNIGMIPLGSCTMKLNAAATMLPMSWAEVGNLHPLVPDDQSEGYRQMILALEERLKTVSGFAAVSLQPNSGAQGEYAGIRVIRAYHQSKGEGHRNLCFIPTNAHGTNPATATLCGYNVVPIKCLHDGRIDVEHLQQMCAQHKDNVACIMVTYPSTFGVFDSRIKQVTKAIHDVGGQVYIDGANFNAMVGVTGPEFFDGDVCHFNLHKTFSIPHGGGGPGMGPIACRAHLAPFLPNTSVTQGAQVGGSRSFGQTSMAAYGSASILNISYMEMSMLGTHGLTKSTQAAILAANYLATKLQSKYDILFRGDTGKVAHEFIMDIRPIKAACGIDATDIAKRLIDYGFHAPTLSFPVAGTLMVEPTESETKEELDRFVEAMLQIRAEIQDVIDGKVAKDNNLLVNAPHTAAVVTAEKWDRPYTRQQAAFPTHHQVRAKYWPTAGRVDNEYGDLNLICSCEPMPQA